MYAPSLNQDFLNKDNQNDSIVQIPLQKNYRNDEMLPMQHHHSSSIYQIQTPLSRGQQKISNPGDVVPIESLPTTLFLGDLSVICTEEKLFYLFQHFGEIDNIQLKKSDRDPQRAHLGFGFLKFRSHESADRAVRELNGHFFLGRSMRVGWAEEDGMNRQHRGIYRNAPGKSFDQKKTHQTAQIHVSFTSPELNLRISELDLGNVFQPFGNLVDIAIKKNAINLDLRVQSGYAFLHFHLTNEGIRSAVAAVEQINNKEISNIAYQCKVTHSLQVHIFSLKYQQNNYAPKPVDPTPSFPSNGPLPPVPTQPWSVSSNPTKQRPSYTRPFLEPPNAVSYPLPYDSRLKSNHETATYGSQDWSQYANHQELQTNLFTSNPAIVYPSIVSNFAKEEREQPPLSIKSRSFTAQDVDDAQIRDDMTTPSMFSNYY